MSKLFLDLKKVLIDAGKDGISLEKRLVLLFLLFLVTIMLSIYLILYLTGVFNSGMKENEALFEKELSHITQDIYSQFADLSLRSVSLSDQVSESIEFTLSKHNIKPSELYNNPQLLNEILSTEFDKLFGGLQASKSSGIFLILDATINPGISNSKSSRSGLFFKKIESTTINLSYQDIRYMRGPAGIGRSHSITILPQWEMEFDISNADYYNIPIKTAKHSDLSLSRLYYWCSQSSVDGYNTAMFCSTPLIASDGTVFGVVGFEVSNMLFKLSYSPDNSAQSRIFCILAPSDNNYLYMENAMFAGNYSVSKMIPTTPTKILKGKSKLNRYICNEIGNYYGLDNNIQFYADDSPYNKEQWSVSLLVPESDMKEMLSRYNNRIILLLILLTVTFAILSFLISRKYLRPVKHAFETIKSQNIKEHEKTGIPEIDDLLLYLAKEDENSKSIDSAAHNTLMFESFVENIKTLSMAEKAVFDLYLKGHTAKEISEILCLSINTIKTHNKRIYMKLNVSSRKELLVYTQMMQEVSKDKKSIEEN